MTRTETARFISHFSAILAEEADRYNLSDLARLLRDAEAEANEHAEPTASVTEGPSELRLFRRH